MVGAIQTKQFIGIIFPFIEHDDFTKKYIKYNINDVLNYNLYTN